VFSQLLTQFSGTVENELMIIGGWLFDGTSDERKPNAGIVIRDGRFLAVGPDDHADWILKIRPLRDY